MEMLEKIFIDLKSNPRDLKTIPLNKDGLWFYVYTYPQHGIRFIGFQL